MSERNDGNSLPQNEISKIGTVTQNIEETEPVAIDIIERVCSRLRENNLANLVVLKSVDESGKINRRVRDFSPRVVAGSDDKLESIDTQDFIFARYFSAIATDSYFILISDGQNHDDAVDKVSFNIDQTIDDFAKRGQAYEAFCSYLSNKNVDSASSLVESITNSDNGIVEIGSNPLLVRVIVDDFDSQASFRNAAFKSDDVKTHRSFTAIMDGLLGKAFVEGGISEEAQTVLWGKYFYPLAEAATLDRPNRFAVRDMVKIFRNTFGENLERNIVREKFNSNEDYNIFRNVQLEILDIAFSRSNEEFEEMLAEYYLDSNGSISSQMGHFLSVLHSAKVFGLPYPHLHEWTGSVYPEDSIIGQIVEDVYHSYDLPLAVDIAAGEAIRMLVASDAETGPDEQEFLVSKCLGYMNMDIEENKKLISNILDSGNLSKRLRKILHTALL